MTFIRQQFVAKNKQSTEIELNWGVGVGAGA